MIFHCIRSFVLLIVLFIALTPAFATHPQGAHHDLRVSLIPSKAGLSGTDSIRLEPGESDGLEFDLARSAQVSRVTVEDSDRPFTFRDGRLRIPIQPDEKSGVITVKIEYSAVFNDPVPDMPLNTDNPGYGVTGIISEKGCFLLEGAGWYPRIPGNPFSCSNLATCAANSAWRGPRR